MYVPGVFVEDPAVKTLDDLVKFAEDRAKTHIEKYGNHAPFLIGKTETHVAIFDFSMFSMRTQSRQVVGALRGLLPQLGISMCVFITESVALDLGPAPDNALLEQYQKGELKIDDHPDKKHVLQFFIQRPGLIRCVFYEVKTKDEKTILENRVELPNPVGKSPFLELYDHDKVN